MGTKTILIGVAAVLVLGVASIWVVGALLPKQHRASVAVDLDAPIAEVWRLVRTIDSGAVWRTGVEEVTRLSDRSQETYAESSRFGVINYVVELESPESKLVTRIVDNKDFGGTWTYDLAERDGGTRTHLTVTEDGEIYSPMFRFFARFVFGYDKTLEGYTRDLAAAVTAPR